MESTTKGSSSSSAQSAIRFPEETETSDQSMRGRGGPRLQTATKTIDALLRRRRNVARKRKTSRSNSSPSYSRSTASSCAYSSEKKSSSHRSKTPFASRARSSAMKSSSHRSKVPASSQHPKSLASSRARSSGKKSPSHHSKPMLSRSRLPYHERPSRRQRSTRQSIELARRIQRGKEEAKAQKEKEEAIFVFNVRKRVLVDWLQSLYDQPDDAIIAIRVNKDQLRTLSEHEALKERRRQRRQGE
ncbi:unnamed protein product, partial [Mesorhabditis belari]|uniref:Uncharacterized protein n=1 Tax=Mesorhabditis belari TaxID=2138241 RepID=A0AAF3FLN7_9BILA